MQEKVGEQGRLISPCLKAGTLRHILVRVKLFGRAYHLVGASVRPASLWCASIQEIMAGFSRAAPAAELAEVHAACARANFCHFSRPPRIV